MNLTSLITGPARLGLSIGGRVLGLIQSRLGGTPRVDDETLASQVESGVFGSGRVSTDDVEVDVTEGVVWLRGEVGSIAFADEVEARAGAVDGVVRVENLIRVANARPKPPAATAPPPEAEPVGSPPAPFPSLANGSSAGERSG
jgi:hypothetical protein